MAFIFHVKIAEPDFFQYFYAHGYLLIQMGSYSGYMNYNIDK